MDEMCTDNRFELIEKYKKELIESTNIETSPEEMNVLDNILFRFWQMGWLDSIDRMLLVKESAKTLMHSGGDSVFAKTLRNAGRFIQNAIDGEALELEKIPSAQPETEKYEYHYDHTDCIWYRPEARNRCPTTCAQYRDGWNDAMNYIFRDGKGYRPYRRDKQYGE